MPEAQASAALVPRNPLRSQWQEKLETYARPYHGQLLVFGASDDYLRGGAYFKR